MTHVENITLVPTSSMSFDKHILILRAYVVLSNNGIDVVHYKMVMRRTGLARTQISGVNSFFVSLGVLKKKAKGEYMPAEAVVHFVGNRPGNEVFFKLVSIVASSPLYNFVEGLLRIHGKVTKEDAIGYLLKESGEKTVSRAERALDWLEKVGLIVLSQDEYIEIQEEAHIDE